MASRSKQQRIDALAAQGIGPGWAEFTTKQEAKIQATVEGACKEGHELAMKFILKDYRRLWAAEQEPLRSMKDQ